MDVEPVDPAVSNPGTASGHPSEFKVVGNDGVSHFFHNIADDAAALGRIPAHLLDEAGQVITGRHYNTSVSGPGDQPESSLPEAAEEAPVADAPTEPAPEAPTL